MMRLKMKNCNTILIEKLKNIIPIKKIEIEIYQYLTGEEVVHTDQNQIIEKIKFDIHCWKRLLKSKQKQLNINEINKLNQLKSMANS